MKKSKKLLISCIFENIKMPIRPNAHSPQYPFAAIPIRRNAYDPSGCSMTLAWLCQYWLLAIGWLVGCGRCRN
jgi:hypothetical protein